MNLWNASSVSTRPDAGQQLLEELSRRFTLEPAEPLTHACIFSDSFGWALHRAGLALEIAGARYRLLDLASGAVIHEAVESSVHAPRFAWDFADPVLRKALGKRLKLRALIGLVTITGEGRRFSLRDRHGDLCGRVEVSRLCVRRGAESRPFLLTCSFGTIDRDSPAAQAAARIFANGDWSPAPALLLEPALACAGLQAAAYSAKIGLELAPDLTTGEAAVLVARRLAGILEANLPGLKQDIDTEFLHDFRVAVRKSRSLLKLLAGAFPDPALDRFAPALQRIGRETGDLRDLDVYLLMRKEYAAMVPEILQPGLEDYFGHLAERRVQIHRDLVAFLDGEDFAADLKSWAEFLAGDPGTWTPHPPLAGRPVAETARTEIRRLWKQVLRRGERITPASKDRALHRLRIRCKELRYALEFFSSLLPAAQTGKIIAQLKSLQSNLGEFNDLSVQLDHLNGLLAGTGAAAPSPREAATLGALILQLHQRRLAVRGRFARTFEHFAGRRNRRLLRELLGPETPA